MQRTWDTFAWYTKFAPDDPFGENWG